MGENKVLKSAEIPRQELNAQAIAEAEAAIAESEAIIAEAERAITMAEEALRFAETETVLNPPTCRKYSGSRGVSPTSQENVMHSGATD